MGKCCPVDGKSGQLNPRYTGPRAVCIPTLSLRKRWWGILWAKAARLMGRQAYLNRAKSIFNDVRTRGITTSCRGGVLWKKGDPFKASIVRIDLGKHCVGDGRVWMCLLQRGLPEIGGQSSVLLLPTPYDCIAPCSLKVCTCSWRCSCTKLPTAGVRPKHSLMKLCAHGSGGKTAALSLRMEGFWMVSMETAACEADTGEHNAGPCGCFPKAMQYGCWH